MFIEGAKDIVTNQMHARIPNSSIKRSQWLNLCIDMQSFTNECFGRTAVGSVSGSSTTSQIGGPMGDISPGLPTNIYKCLEQIQLEGRMRIRKIFSSRSQIPCEATSEAEL